MDSLSALRRPPGEPAALSRHVTGFVGKGLQGWRVEGKGQLNRLERGGKERGHSDTPPMALAVVCECSFDV